MQLSISELLYSCKAQSVEEVDSLLQKKTSEFAREIVQCNEMREINTIVTQTPFYSKKGSKLEHITLRKITINEMPSIIAFQKTFQLNLTPLTREADAFNQVKDSVKRVMEFIYDIDCGITGRNDYISETLSKSNIEFYLLYDLALKIISCYGELISAHIMELEE